MKSDNPREIELKFQLRPGSRKAIEASPIFANADTKRSHLVTTYFDTPEGILDRAGLTLRVRRIGKHHVQTVKSRANGRGVASNRNEWEWEIEGTTPDLGRLARIPALAMAVRNINRGVRPVFVTDIRRTTRLLRLDSNTLVEVALDEGAIKADDARELVNELELELKAGSAGPMYRLALQLHALAPIWISSDSKAARGWHLRTGQAEGARFAQMPKVSRRIEAAAALREILSGTLGHLTANIGSTLRGDPEALHQMRIAIRETRATLQLFERHLDASAVGRFSLELRRFGEVFGAARDWDVFCLETLSRAMADLSGERLEDLNLAGEVERQFAHAAMANAVRGRDFTALLLGVAVWAEAGLTDPSMLGDRHMGERLLILAPSLLKRVERKAKRRAKRAETCSAIGRHRLRKALKKLCFDVESLSGLYRSHAVKNYRIRSEALEGVLGAANDAAVTQRLVSTLATVKRPDLAKPAAALRHWNKRRSQIALDALDSAVKDFRAASVFWA